MKKEKLSERNLPKKFFIPRCLSLFGFFILMQPSFGSQTPHSFVCEKAGYVAGFGRSGTYKIILDDYKMDVADLARIYGGNPTDQFLTQRKTFRQIVEIFPQLTDKLAPEDVVYMGNSSFGRSALTVLYVIEPQMLNGMSGQVMLTTLNSFSNPIRLNCRAVR